MGLKYRSFTDQQFIDAVKNNYSISKVLTQLNLHAAGANYRMFKILVKSLNLDISHFTGKAHLRGQKHNWSKKIPLDDLLVKGSIYSGYKLKNRLLKEGRLINQCFQCHISIWQGKELKLALHHIDGDPTNNCIENLQLLCPNCHSQTNNYCGKNRKKKKPSVIIKPIRLCELCNKPISKYSTGHCLKCSHLFKKGSQPKIEWPPINELIDMKRTLTYSEISQKLGITKSAVAKHIKKFSQI